MRRRRCVLKGCLWALRWLTERAAFALASLQLTSEVSVGIDLGTTFSVVAVCQHGQVSVVQARALAAQTQRPLARPGQLTRRRHAG